LLTITQLGIHFENWLPFKWRGYRQRTRYTYIIQDLSNINAVFQNFNTNVKRNIKKGEDLIVETSEDTHVLYHLAQNSLARTGSKLNFSLETLNLLYLAIQKNNSGQIFQVKNTEHEILASALIVWDKEKAYFLLAGDDKKHPSATTILIWEVLQKMSEKGITSFDFEGSMLEPIETFYRSFGATRQCYHLVYKAKNRFWSSIFTFLKLI
jgi:lipid II:glycine glycyltransferase (peptidoglycan interpeptide bridge formation enzyme)